MRAAAAFAEELDRLAGGSPRDAVLLHELVLRRYRPVRQQVTRLDTGLDGIRHLHIQRRRSLMVDHPPTISLRSTRWPPSYQRRKVTIQLRAAETHGLCEAASAPR